MKNLKMFLVIVISFTFFSARVDAAVCDKADIARLKELASYVDISYESLEESGVYNSYNVLVLGLTNDIYILDDLGNTYNYSRTENGVFNIGLPSGNRTFKIYSTNCPDILLNKISIQLTRKNLYSFREECKKLEKYNLNVCDENYQGEITEEYFIELVSSYLENDISPKDNNSFWDKIVNFFSNYYFVIIGVGVIVVVVILSFVRIRKRSVLE